jgi:hypothetical protein
VTVIASDEPFAADLQSFGDAISGSTWYKAFAAEYGLQGTATHVLVKGAHVAAGLSFTEAQMKQYVAASIAAASPAPTPDGHTVYVLYLPPETSMTLNGAPDTACKGVPYHTEYGALGDGMAVLNRCPGSFPSQLEMFTTVAAHEIAEAATDSNPNVNPAWEMWVDDQASPWKSSVWNQVEMESSAENGDLCIFTRVVEKGFPFQRIYSNAAAKAGGDPCVPALPVPYFSVSPKPETSGWIQVTAGAGVDVPITGWSTAPTSDWVVWAAPLTGKAGSTFATTLTGAAYQQVGKYQYPKTNNGDVLTLHVTIPSGVASSWWGAVALWSWHAEPNGNYVPGEDFGHEAVVGFYIP